MDPKDSKNQQALGKESEITFAASINQSQSNQPNDQSTVTFGDKFIPQIQQRQNHRKKPLTCMQELGKKQMLLSRQVNQIKIKHRQGMRDFSDKYKDTIYEHCIDNPHQKKLADDLFTHRKDEDIQEQFISFSKDDLKRSNYQGHQDNISQISQIPVEQISNFGDELHSISLWDKLIKKDKDPLEDEVIQKSSMKRRKLEDKYD